LRNPLSTSDIVIRRQADFSPCSVGQAGIIQTLSILPTSYPGFLVAIAEMKMKEKVASKVIPVGETAIRDKWFEHL
jgi:hypothetical protein